MIGIIWGQKYIVDIPLLDEQHRVLLDFTNDLHEACETGVDAVDVKFRETIKKAAANDFVHYLKFWLWEHVAERDKEFASYFNAKR